MVAILVPKNRKIETVDQFLPLFFLFSSSEERRITNNNPPLALSSPIRAFRSNLSGSLLRLRRAPDFHGLICESPIHQPWRRRRTNRRMWICSMRISGELIWTAMAESAAPRPSLSSKAPVCRNRSSHRYFLSLPLALEKNIVSVCAFMYLIMFRCVCNRSGVL